MRTSVLIGLMLMTAAMGVLCADPVSAGDPVQDLQDKLGDPSSCARAGTWGVSYECGGACVKVIINGFGYCKP